MISVKVLASTATATATRNHDYYNAGEWLPLHYFMNVIRKSEMTPLKGK